MNYYQPAEDSYLLEKVITEQTFGGVTRILDMCSGSGILAFAARKAYPNAEIVAADINPHALAAISEQSKKTQANIEVVHSNLFEKLKGTFDLIICNPPYLPAHKLDPDDLLTKALIGGKKGYEFSVQFLEQAKQFLSPGGHILFLFSSQTNKAIIDQKLFENLYQSTLVANQYVGMFETLFVYHIVSHPHVALLRTKGYTDISYYIKGHHGIILKAHKNQTPVIVKIAKNVLQKSVMFKEKAFLEKVNKLELGPKLIDAEEDFVTMEYIQGKQILEYIESVSREHSILLIKKILKQLYTLDKNGIQKFELTNPYKHIIVTDKNEPVLIDFERCIYATYPKNVSQFVQFLQSGKFTTPFLPKLDPKVTQLVQKYKLAPTEHNLKPILELIA